MGMLDKISERRGRIEYPYGDVKVVRSEDYTWGVLDSDGNEIVPFGKYAWIDVFDQGLARVRTQGETTDFENIIAIIGEDNKWNDDKASIIKIKEAEKAQFPERFSKWGIINVYGEEVLPAEYDSIWKFAGKQRFSTKVIKEGEELDIYFCDLNPELPDRRSSRITQRGYRRDDYDEYDDYNEYDDYDGYESEYSGTYAHDVEHLSDDFIDDVLDGDPDAYWNID